MKRITMAHGAGGEVMQDLIKSTILKHLLMKSDAEIPLDALDDAGAINDIVFTTDSHTVKPLFFPGGDIGSLAVCGTINDIAVMGVKPVALSSAFVMEEGLPFSDFEKILASMHHSCEYAEVPIITGDTKVVEKGALDKMIINTSAIGIRNEVFERNIKEIKKYRKFDERWLKDSNLRAGDKVILSGYIGDHGIALLSFREGYGFESEVQSDVAPLNKMLSEAMKVGGIVAMKDPTRGGLANTLNESSDKSKVGILIEEDKIPIREPVRAACEMLGLDALEIGNEGKAVIAVVKEKVEDVLRALRKTKEGKEAQIIGECKADIKGVVMKTVVGGKRVVEPPIGDPIPRIC
jgi:hydrogenase expression/formation protein HypE